MIQTFEMRFPTGTREELAARFGSSNGDYTPPSGEVSALFGPLLAEVLESRWVVRCPFCAGAELMAEDGLFFCHECRNTTVRNAYLKVSLPDPTERSQVEAVLSERPVPSQRNYQHGETLKGIVMENIDAGLPVPFELSDLAVQETP